MSIDDLQISSTLTAQDLMDFEKEIADLFEAGQINSPIHLSGGNETQLTEIFKNIRPQDWCLCQWRSHYHCLLKGVLAADVKAAILAGRSIALCFPDHRVLSSAIVGGIAPIATGLAWSIKRRGGDEKVWCFVGDMTAESGIFHESLTYSDNHVLPVFYVVENNEKSVCTITKEVWGEQRWLDGLSSYHYDLTWPHVGTGRWVKF